MMFVVDGVNPEPWTSGTVTTGRKGGRVFGRLVKDAGLRAFQLAVQAQLLRCYPGWTPVEGPVSLELHMWRELPRYERSDGRIATRNRSDATNMQKALEDALQADKKNDFPGLFVNDRQVLDVRTRVYEQSAETESLIVIDLTELEPADLRRFAERGSGLEGLARAVAHQRRPAPSAQPQPRDVEGLF